MMNHKQVIVALLPFVKDVSGKSGEKAVKDMARAIAGALAEAEISVKQYKEAYHCNNIFDAGCLLGSHASIFDFVTPDYLAFCKVMFELRPIGMGTPNAAVGEGEFMSVFCSPAVKIAKMKGKGDILVNEKYVELKGSGIRIFGDVTGAELQRHAQSISKKYGVNPNTATKNRVAFEPWYKNQGGKKVSHWKEQFKVMGVDKSCRYLTELCGAFMDCSPDEFQYCFDEKDVFDVMAMERFILKKLFAAMQKEWDAFTVIDNAAVKCLHNDDDAFANMVESGDVEVTGNYFRSFQETKIGLYVKIK